MKVFLAREARDGQLLRLALYAVSVALIAYVLWGMVSESWVHEDYVGASLVFVAVITATLVTFLHRNRPRDKFQFFHPWKIQETTTSKDLWLIAGFDTLVGLAMFGAFMALAHIRNRRSFLRGHGWRDDDVSDTPEWIPVHASSVRHGECPRGFRRSSDSAEVQGLFRHTLSPDVAGGCTHERSGLRRAAFRGRVSVLTVPHPARPSRCAW